MKVVHNYSEVLPMASISFVGWVNVADIQSDDGYHAPAADGVSNFSRGTSVPGV